MSPPDMTRRRVLTAVGAASVVGLAGGNTVASTQRGNDDQTDAPLADEHDIEEQFGAVRVGNLVPDLALGPRGGPPGNGPPEDTPGQPPESVPGRRGAHAPDSTALDLYVGKPPDMNATIGRVYYSTFGPGPADSYLQVPPREYDFTVTRSGSLEPRLEETLGVDPGVRYTALAVGRAHPDGGEPEFQSLFLEDAQSREEATPPADMADVRFVHASPDAGPVDIAANGLSVLEGAAFGDASPYIEIPPGEYTADVHSGGETVLSLTAQATAGTRLTVYVIGLAGVDGQPNGDGMFGLGSVATIDGLNPLPDRVLTR